MEKNKKSLNEEKKKGPFNVLKGGAMALAFAGAMAASPFVFAGCAEAEKGDAGTPGTQWYSGEDYADLTAEVRNGDFFFDTNDNIIYQKTANGWVELSNVKGDEGKQGNGVSGVNVVYEYDNNGNIWSVVTVSYTDGEPQVVRTLVPKRVVSVDGLTLKDTGPITKIAKLANNAAAPEFYAQVTFDDETIGQVVLTDDMLLASSDEELDLTEEGTQYYQINCRGKSYGSALEVVDISVLGYSTDCSFPGGYSRNFRNTTNLKDVYVELKYDENSVDAVPVYAPLSMVASQYVNEETETESQTIDMTQVGEYTVVLQDKYKRYTIDGNDSDISLRMNVYNASVCTVERVGLQYGILNLEYGAELNETLLNTIKATKVHVNLYEENKDGQYNYEATIGDLVCDLTKIDTNTLGYHSIPYKYQIEGQTGYYEDELVVYVDIDISTFTKVGDYTVAAGQEMQMMMFNMVFLNEMDTMTLYHKDGVGIAAVDYDDGSYQTTYKYAYNYSALEDGMLKLKDSVTGGEVYFTVDNDTKKISFFEAEGTPAKYTLQMNIQGELFDTILDVYGDTATRATKVTIFMPGENPGDEGMWLDYSFIDCTWETEGTDTFVSFGNRTFKVTTSTKEVGGTTYTVLEEVQA